MAVALEQKIGNATIRIHDDACKDKTPEEARKILQRIADSVQGEAVAAELRRETKEAESRHAEKAGELPPSGQENMEGNGE